MGKKKSKQNQNFLKNGYKKIMFNELVYKKQKQKKNEKSNSLEFFPNFGFHRNN